MSLTTKDIGPTRADIARRILTSNQGDLDRATTELVALARTNKELHDDLLYGAAREALASVARMDRDRAFESTKSPFTMGQGTKAAQDRARRSGNVVQMLLMDMPIPIDGVVKPLREWTGQEVAGYAETEVGRAKTALRRAVFLKAVAAVAGANKVGAVLDESKLRMLNAEAEQVA